MTRKVDGVVSVSQPVEDRLSERRLLDYEEFKRDFVEWLLHVGKQPEKADGYARDTVEPTSSRIDLFYRWLWDREETYTTTATPKDASAYLDHLVYSEKNYSNSHKSNTQKSLKRLFKCDGIS